MNPFGIMIFLASMTAAPAAWPAQDDGRLDGLFERLRRTPDAVEASALEARIWQIWLRSPEAEVNHLMAGGIRRMDRGRLAEARDAFAEITRLAPNFAEGWNKLATVNYLLRDYNASAHDIARTLRLEPRHFGALSGLGLANMALPACQGAQILPRGLKYPSPHARRPQQNFALGKASEGQANIDHAGKARLTGIKAPSGRHGKSWTA